MKQAHSRTSLSHVHSETQTLQRQNANVSSLAKRALPSFTRDRWRNCRLNSSNSIGSECCLEFVIFLQPMIRVTVIHDWVMTYIMVHERFTTDGYALPVPHVLRTFAWKFSNTDFFRRLYHLKLMSYLCQKCKKNRGSPTSFRREQAERSP